MPASNLTRLTAQAIPVDLAKYRNIADYNPKIGDVIVYHGWFRHWFGLVSIVNGTDVYVIVENLPKLLLTLSEAQRARNTIKKNLLDIRSSRGGEYAIIQDGTWFVDD